MPIHAYSCGEHFLRVNKFFGAVTPGHLAGLADFYEVRRDLLAYDVVERRHLAERAGDDHHPILVEVGDLDLGGAGFGAAQLVHHRRPDQAGQQRDDGDHHQHLDQGEATRGAGSQTGE